MKQQKSDISKINIFDDCQKFLKFLSPIIFMGGRKNYET